MRLEPYRYFEFDADLQQYTPSFMGVQCEVTANLSTINEQVTKGTRLHLVDSCSSVYIAAQGYVNLANQNHLESHGGRGSKFRFDVTVNLHSA